MTQHNNCQIHVREIHSRKCSEQYHGKKTTTTLVTQNELPTDSYRNTSSVIVTPDRKKPEKNQTQIAIRSTTNKRCPEVTKKCFCLIGA